MNLSWSGILAIAALGMLAPVGCSSAAKCPAGYTCTMGAPSGATGTGSTAGSGTLSHKFNDGAASGNGSTISIQPDGTTGQKCTKDADCIGEGGAGINKCSGDFQLTYFNVGVQLWDPPVCIIPLSNTGNCDPAPPSDPTGQGVHFCDGPDDISAPGICLPLNTSQPVSGQGICYPKCMFGTDGSPATGCVGNNACGLWTYLLDPTSNKVQGIGYCQSACQKDSDCAALGTNYACEVDTGNCTMAKVVRTKQIGSACTIAGTTNDEKTGACFCATGQANDGFCTSSCVVGGAACPSGWVCDAGEPTTLDFGAGSPTFPPLTKQTQGMLGTCVQACSVADGGGSAPMEASTPDGSGNADGAADGSQAPVSDAMPMSSPAPASCPPGGYCKALTVAGPDCLASSTPDGG